MKRTLNHAVKARVRLAGRSILLLVALAVPAVAQTDREPEKAEPQKQPGAVLQTTKSIAKAPKVQVEEIEVAHRRMQTVISPTPIERISVDNPKYVDVYQSSPKEIGIIGLERGSTTVTMWRENGPGPIVYRVQVIADRSPGEQSKVELGKLERQLAILFPQSQILLVSAKDRLVVKGVVKDPNVAAQVVHIVEAVIKKPLFKNRFQSDLKNSKPAIVNLLAIDANKPEPVAPADLYSIRPVPSFTAGNPNLPKYASNPSYQSIAGPAATYPDPTTGVEQVHFDVVMAVIPNGGLDEWAKKHDADIKRIEAKSHDSARGKPALQFEPEVRQALLTMLKGNAATTLMNFPATVTVWGREVRVDTGDVPEEEGGMNVRLTPTQIGKGELRLKIASEFHLSDELKKVVPPTNWNLNLRTRANSTFLLPLAELGAVQRIVLLIQPKIVTPVRATILGTPYVAQRRKVVDVAPQAQPVAAGIPSAYAPTARVSQPATVPSAPTRAADPAPPGQQVHLEVLFAVVPDEVLIKWAIPHKAIIKRVASNESRPAPPKKPGPAASRQFSMLFGSEAPVPLLFDAELRESLLTALKKDTRTNWLRGTSVMTAWAREVCLKTPLGVKENTPLTLRMLPTEIGKGEFGLVIDAEVPSIPDVPGGKKAHWNLRARAGHTLMLPLAQPDLEKQLVLFVVPKIIAERPVPQYATPPLRYQPFAPKQNQPAYQQQYQPVTPKVYQPVPTTRYQPVPQTSYRPVPRTTVTSLASREVVSISLDLVVADANLIPDRTVEFTTAQRKWWLKSLAESKTSTRQQMSVAAQWDETTRLTPPVAEGKKAPFDLQITPKLGEDGQIILDVKGKIALQWPDKKDEIGLDTTLKTRSCLTVLMPLPIKQPDGRKVALLIQPDIIPSSPPVQRPVARPAPQATPTPAKEEAVAILKMLVLDVDAKIAREVVAKSRTTDLKLRDVDVQFPKENGSKKRSPKKLKTQMRTFLIDASLGKLLVADLKKQDDSFKVISRPQIRTIVGVSAAMEIRGGDGPTKQVAGVGNLKIHVTPKRVGEDLMVNSHLILTGAGDSSGPEAGIKVEAEALQKCRPATTAVVMLGGKEGDRSIILLTDLAHLEPAKSQPARPVAQALPTPLGYPSPTSADPRTVMQHWQQSVTRQPGVFNWKAAPAKPTNMRVVTVHAMIGTAVSPGDIVDVLVMLKEHGDAAKDIKMETLFESLTVFESAEASLGSCTNVKVLAEKEIVGDLLLAGNKGLLRLIVHRPPIQRNAFPVYQGDSTPTFPQGTRMIYRDNGTWGPADAPIQASGVQSPQPASPRERPKSEVQQVLEEVREMRKLIQGLREDMNALRNSVGSKSKRETSQRTDLLISKGQSQTMTRTKRIIRVDGFDPKILAVLPVKPNSLRLLGRGLGRTTVEVWFEGDAEESEKVVVEVAPDIPVQRPTTGVAPPKAADHEPVFTRTIKRGTPSKPIAAPRGPHTELRVALNHSHLLKRDKKFTRIAVAAPEVADFVQYSLQEAGIIGQKPGSTDLTIWYEGDPVPETFEIVVVGPSGDDDPFSSTGSKEEDAARRQIEQALKKSISIDMTDGTLKDALKQLHQTAGVNIAIDSAALEDEGVTTDVKVSLHLSGVSLRAALKILLSPFNLTTLIEDEVLKVTSQVRAKGSLIAVVYQVKDLTQTEKDGKADFDSLIELITTVVEPDSWQEVGGMGAIAPNPTTSSLVVRQTQDAHEEIQELFSALRKWNSGVAPVQFDSGQKQSFFKPASHRKGTFPVYGPRPTRNGMIPHPVKNPLNRTISVSFEDDTLKDVLSYLATALDVQLSIDQAALEEEGITERQVVSINVDDIMAKSALNLILEPLSLGAVLEGGKTLRVTSLSQLKSRQTVRVYPVKHLLADPDIIDMKKLTEMITISVEPDSWQALGGDATLTPNEKTKSLVIRQSRETHEKIRVLLEDLNDLVVTPGEAATKAGPQKTASPNGKDTTEKTAEEISPDIGVPIDIPRRKSTR